MTSTLTRPEQKFGSGLFRRDHFQIAYNTSDIDRAAALFGERYGIRDFQKLEGPTPDGGQIRMYIAWAGGVMYELIWGEGPGTDVFRANLPAGGFAIRPHHLGYHVPDEEAWGEVLAEVARSGRQIVHNTHVAGFLRAVIVEQPELGHFLEYILPEAGGVRFFENAPGN